MTSFVSASFAARPCDHCPYLCGVAFSAACHTRFIPGVLRGNSRLRVVDSRAASVDQRLCHDSSATFLVTPSDAAGDADTGHLSPANAAWTTSSCPAAQRSGAQPAHTPTAVTASVAPLDVEAQCSTQRVRRGTKQSDSRTWSPSIVTGKGGCPALAHTRQQKRTFS